ncbi:hypothetical protein COLO4_06494 [Corchorus olitorius]|uniref:Uncharacterized protein n=1 Tax=Corchorus olitorius TaxID=93759 RepID=A0A1R3KMV0_9ROSI|nr:hypothetical protein COLO4_06494 [Corchorus olitorius]
MTATKLVLFTSNRESKAKRSRIKGPGNQDKGLEFGD